MIIHNRNKNKRKENANAIRYCFAGIGNTRSALTGYMYKQQTNLQQTLNYVFKGGLQ